MNPSWHQMTASGAEREWDVSVALEPVETVSRQGFLSPMNAPSSSETAKSLQQFVNAHPWLFALAWVMIFPMIQLIRWVIRSNFHLSPVTSLLVTVTIYTGLVIVAFVFLSQLSWWCQTGFMKGIGRKDVLVCLFPTLPTLFGVLFVFPLLISGSVKISLGLLILIAILSCLIGVAEESIFRGIILQTLLPKGVLRALFLSTLLFALLHVGNLFAGLPMGFILGQVLSAFGGGMAYAVMRVRTGSIWPAVILHSLDDFIALALITATGVGQPTLLGGLLAGGFWCSVYVIYAAIALRPSKLRELRTRYRFEQYEEAVKAYDRAIQLDPMDVKTFYGKGFALNKLKRYEEALVAYDRAIQLDPNEGTAFNNKGFILNKLGRYEEALVALDEAIRLNSRIIQSFYNKGDALSNLDRYEEALQAYEKALELDPTNQQALQAIAQINRLYRR